MHAFPQLCVNFQACARLIFPLTSKFAGLAFLAFKYFVTCENIHIFWELWNEL